jgi:hypothetical protein
VGKIGQIIKIRDVLYEVLGTMDVERSNDKGTEYWKEKWGADIVLRNGDLYYFCRNVLEAEWTE